MKKLLLLFFNLLFFSVFAQNYNMSNAPVNTCAGTFYDSGGATGNYGNNQNFTKTFCPTTPGAGIRLNFSAFNLGTGDVMTIYNGPNTTSPAFGTYSGTDSPSVVQATTENPTGCITVQFTSDASVTGTGWVAAVSCIVPCQAINAVFNGSSPAQDADGVIRICQNTAVTFNGSATFSSSGAGATYTWDFNNGTTGTGASATTTFVNPGVYRVNLLVRDANNCTNQNFLNIIVQVSTTPDFTGTTGPSEICFGDPATLTGVVTAVPFNYQCTPPVSGTTFLPDGSGVSYQTSVTVDCFSSGQTLTNINQLQQICLNMEHSYLGDLEITITSPSGQVAILKPYNGAGGGGSGLHLGHPFDPGGTAEDVAAGPGIGLDYCFSMSGTTFLVNGATIPSTNDPGNTVVPGTYLPTGSFASLIGSPLNGNWTITVTDNLASDNGYIFSWGLTFDPALVPGDLSFTPTIVSATWDVGSGNPVTVTPTTEGEHCYTYTAIDNFDCEYHYVVCVNVQPEILLGTPKNFEFCTPPPATIDLTENTPLVLGALNPGDYLVSYFHSQADANSNFSPIFPDNAYVSTQTETIYIRVESFNSGCFKTVPFQIIFGAVTTIGTLPNLSICDENPNDGIGVFNLTSQNAAALNGQNPANYTVSYYNNQADADAGINAIGSPATYTGSNNEVIYVRVVGSTPTCFATSSFTLFVIPTSVIVDPAPMHVCDENLNYDGFSTFMLTNNNAAITGGNPDLVVSYYATQADAALGAPSLALPSPYPNIVPNTQTVCVRVVNVNAPPTGPQCPAFTTLVLVVDPRPLINTNVSNYGLCDYDNPGDGTEVFDLTTKNAELITNATGMVITYYTSQADATGATNVIAVPTAHVGGPDDIIWFRVENTATGCFSVGSFHIIVNPLPTVVQPTTLFACSDGINPNVSVFNLSTKNNEITGGATGVTVSYYYTQADADSATSPLPLLYTSDGNNPQTIYVRVQNDATTCYDTTSLQLEIIPGPVAITPEPLTYCDPNSDGYGMFTLTDVIAAVTGGATGVTVTFHETPEDADNSINPINTTLPYNNVTPWLQTIYVNVHSTLTPCYDIVELQLIVYPTPIATDPTPYELCDDDGTIDGVHLFNLTTKTPEILGALDPAQHTVSYFTSQANAVGNISPILNVLSYPNTSNPQTLYVRVEHNTTGCFDIVQLILRVNPLPVATLPSLYVLCDDVSGDGVEVFDLGTKVPEIVGTQIGMVVTFFFDEAAANAGTAPLPYIYTNQVPYAQTIVAVVTNPATGCVSRTFLDLRVSPIPTPMPPTENYTVCDADGDGYAVFDLTTLTQDIIDGAPGVSVTYYETETNAQNGNTGILDETTFQNSVAFMQTIWVRIENDDTGCFRIFPIVLEVKAAPVVPALSDLTVCDTNQDGFAPFNLNLQTPIIQAANPGGTYTIRYYVSLANAQQGVPAISSPGAFINSVNPQPIWVRIEDTATGCFDIGTFNVKVNLPPVVTAPTRLYVCDDDGRAIFDITVKNQEIIGAGNDVSLYTFEFYPTPADAQAGTGLITDPQHFDNAAYPLGPHTFGVKVINNATGCFSFTTLTYVILPLPNVATTVAPFELCDNNNPGDGIEAFDLTSYESVIAGSEVNLTFGYYLTPEDALAETNAIPTAQITAYVAGPLTTIYVRATNSLSPGRCGVVVELVLKVNPLPTVHNSNFVMCETDGNGQEVFDLAGHVPTILGSNDPTQVPPQDPADYTVTYYLNATDAQNGVGTLPNMYQNVTIPQQTIAVKVVNNATGCISIADLILLVEDAAVATKPADVTQCDEDGTNDGQIAYDLTTLDAIVRGTQTPAADFPVSYYTSESDAIAGVNAITDATAHMVGPLTTIWIRIVNGQTTTPCVATTSIVFTINKLPEPVINNGKGVICVDSTNGNVLSELLLTIEPASYTTATHSFQWYLGGTAIVGATGNTYSASEVGDYTVQVADTATGCVSLMSPVSVVGQSGPAVFTTTVSGAFSDEQTLTVNVTGGYGDYVFQLDEGTPQTSNVFTNVTPGVHNVKVIDQNGCDFNAPVEVIAINYPHYFTPNGDGYHDTWNIIGLENQPNAKIYIFDRYGKLLKQISSTSEGWNGTYNGQLLPSTDYWFTVTFEEDGQTKEFKAHFSLKR